MSDVPQNVIDDNGVESLFAPLDVREGPQHFADKLGAIADEEGIDITPNDEPVSQPLPDDVVVPNNENQPVTYEYPTGEKVTIAKTDKGWQATLDPGNGANPEVFYGPTKDELYATIAVGKINATKKIQRLNRQQKVAPASPVNEPTTSRKELTADEQFELKTQLTANPGLAMDTWFQKKFGFSTDDAAKYMQAGLKAQKDLQEEVEAKGFINERPEYFPTNENFDKLLNYLNTHHDKQGNTLKFTTQNLVDAFDEYSEAGLLEFAPDDAPQPVQPPAQPKVVKVASAEVPVSTSMSDGGRIVRQERRTPAGLGIRGNASSAAPVSAPRPPTADELEDLSTDDINKLFGDVRRFKAQTVRR